jgi:hypothetical protein
VELCLLETLIVAHLVKKFVAFYGIRGFTSVFAKTHPDHILSQMNSVYTLITCPWRSILILSSCLRLELPSDLFHSGSPTKMSLCISQGFHAFYMLGPSYTCWFDHPTNMWSNNNTTWYGQKYPWMCVSFPHDVWLLSGYSLCNAFKIEVEKAQEIGKQFLWLIEPYCPDLFLQFAGAGVWILRGEGGTEEPR